MPLVGNDIVDLATDCARRRWEDLQFIGKVFGDSEEKAIRNCRRPDAHLWALWACKEASYKIVRKLRPSVSFLPRRYRAHLVMSEDSGISSGTVDTPFGTIPVRVEAGAGFVHGLGVLGSSPHWEQIVHQVLPTGTPGASNPTLSAKFESTRIREVVKGHLSDLFGCRPGAIELVRKRGRRGLGPPAVLVEGVEAAVDLSLSHDGRFLAFAYCSR